VDVPLEDPNEKHLWMTVREAADLLKCSVPYIHKLARRDSPPFATKYVRTGHIRVELRIFRPDFEAFVAKHSSPPSKTDRGRQPVETLSRLPAEAFR